MALFLLSKIWRRSVEFDDLISPCDVWCDTSRSDVKAPIVGKVNKISHSLVFSNVYQSTVTYKMGHNSTYNIKKVF